MKFAIPLLLGFLGIVAVDAGCSDEMPKVVGFDGEPTFTFPPKGRCSDCDDNICRIFDCTCSHETYTTNKEISYTTYNSNGDEVEIKFTPATFYTNSTELELFVSLCEELWIVTDYIAQSAAMQGEYNYNSLSLCFSTAMDTYRYDPDLNSARAKFIIETCHGGLDSSDNATIRLMNLDDDLEVTTSLAEDRARQQTFDTTKGTLRNHLREAENLEGRQAGDICEKDSDCTANEEACLELEACYRRLFSDGGLFGVDPSNIPTVDDIVSDAFLYSECFNVTLSDLVSKKDGVCSTPQK